MPNFNPFLDERPIPQLDINLKVKIKTKNKKDYRDWNVFFSYIMKKPKTKLTFTTVSILRDMSVSHITVDDIIDYVRDPKDKVELVKIKDIFTDLPIDLKIFILALLQISIKAIQK